MKSFIGYLDEIELHKQSSKKSGKRIFSNLTDVTDKERTPEEYKSRNDYYGYDKHKDLGTHPKTGHKITRHSRNQYGYTSNEFHFHSPTHPGRIDLALETASKKHKNGLESHHINGVVSRNRSPIKAHDAYHHLITHHNIILKTGSHTPGSKRTWEKLAQKKDVRIHGWKYRTRFSNKGGYGVNVTTHPSAHDEDDIYDKDERKDKYFHGKERYPWKPTRLQKKLAKPNLMIAHKKIDEVTDYDMTTGKRSGRAYVPVHAEMTAKFRMTNPEKQGYHNYHKIGTHPKTGHHIYKFQDQTTHEYHFHDPKEKGKIDLAVATKVKKHRNGFETHEIQSLATRVGSTIKAHDAYHHLMGKKHKMIITSKSQTAGGQAVWHRLSKMQGVHMHAWDEKEGPKNLHPVHDREDVYQSYKHGKDRGMASVPSHVVAYRD